MSDARPEISSLVALRRASPLGATASPAPSSPSDSPFSA
eukprot:CAMPEP_0182947508 /NCGR_PEP_ID=MMETSP0105_2-20130417/58685_1 /TAXON_ID=81532 ORGANISM="Acanthoeca-like sp., Strain 10tr" /NCGR_SAMPLE_ID=MMETSP0105_2 /ASSEMBLY_ACC=CAM_ASM_000205 /LENGTH=38 /DNA_ID= /DNA_START= /DNA_END= /DNA_ORIENTATION=